MAKGLRLPVTMILTTCRLWLLCVLPDYASGGGCRGMLDSDTYPDDFYPDKLGEATMDLRGNQFTLASNVRFNYTGWRGQLYSSSISSDRKRAEFSG